MVCCDCDFLNLNIVKNCKFYHSIAIFCLASNSPICFFKVDALGDTVTPVVSVHQASSSAVTAESLSTDTKLMLEEVSRYLNLEKLLPSYKVVKPST